MLSLEEEYQTDSILWFNKGEEFRSSRKQFFFVLAIKCYVDRMQHALFTGKIRKEKTDLTRHVVIISVPYPRVGP